jgi:hypothetical protein
MRSTLVASLLSAAAVLMPATIRAQDSGIEVVSQAPAAAVETLDGQQLARISHNRY